MCEGGESSTKVQQLFMFKISVLPFQPDRVPKAVDSNTLKPFSIKISRHQNRILNVSVYEIFKQFNKIYKHTHNITWEEGQ